MHVLVHFTAAAPAYSAACCDEFGMEATRPRCHDNARHLGASFPPSSLPLSLPPLCSNLLLCRCLPVKGHFVQPVEI